MHISINDRERLLTRTRRLKMAKSVHAYVRGNTAKFYEWLQASPAWNLIPQGPAIWICGDCHLGNLGPLADAQHNFEIQIRDLDQTVISNPAFDLIRLGLSLETAARSSDLPGVTTAKMVEAMMDGYARALTPKVDDDLAEPDVVYSVRLQAANRRWRHLAEERLEDVEPSIPIGKRFWALENSERKAVETLFDDRRVRGRCLALAGLGADGTVRVADAAYWRKGCSSLGRYRFAVLLALSKKPGKRERYALVDIKEAIPSVAPAAERTAMPRDPAQRVVAGAKALSPNLGERMITAQLMGRSVFLRELAPQDLKIEVSQFSRKEAVAAAAYLAFVIGVAHARQMRDEVRMAWRDTLLSTHDGNLDAPSWLWRAILDMAAAHEAGYLEHCRKFALSE